MRKYTRMFSFFGAPPSLISRPVGGQADLNLELIRLFYYKPTIVEDLVCCMITLSKGLLADFSRGAIGLPFLSRTAVLVY